MSEATASEKELDTKDDDAPESKSESSPSPAKDAPGGAGTAAHVRQGSGLRNIWTIMKREIAAYFNSPVAFILICVTLVGLGGFFFLYEGGVWQADRASMSRLMAFMPWVLSVLTIPLFTMRSLSDEKRMGTIELLITLPVKDSEVILGKYFAALAMVSVQLLLLIAYPLVMFKFPWHMGAFDWNPFWSGMLGMFLLSAAGVAVGIMYSSFTESQILSFFATAFTLTALFVIGLLVQHFKGAVGDTLAFFSLQTRYEPFARGLIDTRAVVYFVSIAVFCSLVAFRNLESRKWK